MRGAISRAARVGRSKHGRSKREGHTPGSAVRLSRGDRNRRQVESVFGAIRQQLRSRRSLYGHRLTDAQAAFTLIDADGSGSLDMKEVQRLSHRLHMPLTHSELRDAMKQMDADGSGEVDFEEFLAWWAKFSATHGGQVLKSDGAGASPTSAGLDVIEFKV